MDSFSIACTTCQTQLRVRDRSAIGQILTCPKCGSMVLVEPPAETPDLAIGSSRTGPPPLPKAPAASAGAAGSQASPAELSDTVEDPSLYGLADVSLDDVLPDEATAPSAPVVETVPIPDASLPTDDWRSAASATWRPWLLTGCAAVAGVGLAIALFSWLSGDEARPPASLPTLAQPDGPPAADATPETAKEGPAGATRA